jgi:hypothetical protein
LRFAVLVFANSSLVATAAQSCTPVEKFEECIAAVPPGAADAGAQCAACVDNNIPACYAEDTAMSRTRLCGACCDAVVPKDPANFDCLAACVQPPKSSEAVAAASTEELAADAEECAAIAEEVVAAGEISEL